MTASIFIAAAGYIINDYFDINIDQINKPDRMVVEKIIKRRWAILLHWVITTVGLIISLYVSYKTSFLITIVNVLCTLLLWFYSTTFKKKLLSGNIIISLLTAWTVLVLYFATHSYNFTANLSPFIFQALNRIFKFAILYGGFAFIISLVREVVKDIEDIEGDAKYNCKTMPVVWGVPSSKVFAGVWLVVLIGALFIMQFYALQLKWFVTSVYCLVAVTLPLIWILRKLYIAQNSLHYHKVSSLIKMVMLSGILSMLFFKFCL